MWRTVPCCDQIWGFRYTNFYIGFFLDVVGQQRAAMPYLKAAAMAPSADYMGRVFVMHHRRATTEYQTQSPVSRFGSGAYTFSGVVVGGWQLSAGHHDDWDELEALEAMESHRRRGIDTIDMYGNFDAILVHLTRVCTVFVRAPPPHSCRAMCPTWYPGCSAAG